jgi:hypothetical protein
MNTNTITFPEVAGKNLKRKKYRFPQDFPAELTLVLMAFYRHHQLDVDTWLPFAEQLERSTNDLTYLELPVIYKMNPIGQFMLNEGMRAGIPDATAREKTITLYLDKPQFLDQLGIPSENSIQVLLVARNGEIRWRTTGKFTAEKGAALKTALREEISKKNE